MEYALGILKIIEDYPGILGVSETRSFNYPYKRLKAATDGLKRTQEAYTKGPMEVKVLRREGDTGASNAFVNKFAIIVGVADYEDLRPKGKEINPGKFVDLKYSENDARAFESFINDKERSGGDWEVHAFIGHDAKTTIVKRRIDEVLAKATSDDLV